MNSRNHNIESKTTGETVRETPSDTSNWAGPTNFSVLPDISREPRYVCQVQKISRPDDSSIILNLNKPQDFKFLAGQYVWLVLPERTPQKGIVDRRAYSMVSAPSEESLEFYIRLGDNDYLKALNKLTDGDQVEIIGPMGHDFVLTDQGSVIIAGGTGIAPFISLFRNDAKIGNNQLMLFTNKDRPIYYLSELRQLSQNQSFKLFDTYDRPNIKHFKDIIDKNDHRRILISGPQPFVDSVTNILLSKGVVQSRLHFEAIHPSVKDDAEIHNIFKNIDHTGDITKLSDNKKSDHINLKDLFIQVSEQTTNHVILTDSNGIILYANEAAERMTGYSLSEMIGQTPRLWGGLMTAEQYQEIWRIKTDGQPIVHEVLNRHKEGRLYVAIIHLTPLVRNGHLFGYVATEEDITELKNLDQTKSNLMSMASHQLRTPLTSINSYSTMLTTGKIGKIATKQKKIVERIHQASRRMLELIDTLLNVSRIDLGSVVLDNTRLDPKECAQQIIAEISTDTEKRKQTFEIKFDTNLPEVFFDRKYLQMIYQNLLSNASKYTPEGGKISLHVNSVKKGDVIDQHDIPDVGIIIVVIDNGFGIPANDKSKIFGKMFRAENARSKLTEGTGLGLFIIKSVVEQMNGMTWFESTEGHGTTFYVYLPLGYIK